MSKARCIASKEGHLKLHSSLHTHSGTHTSTLHAHIHTKTDRDRQKEIKDRERQREMERDGGGVTLGKIVPGKKNSFQVEGVGCVKH